MSDLPHFPLSEAFVLRGVTVVDPVPGTEEERDLFVADGRFLSEPPGGPVAEVDAAGLVAFPPLTDVHVHARDDIVAAGRAGGFGRLVTMANQSPPVDTPEAVRAMSALGRDGVAVLPAACVTRGRAGCEVAELESLAREGGAVAFSDDGTMVADDAVMEEAMERAAALGLPILDHAMVPALMGAGVVRDCAAARACGWPVVPPETETRAVERDIALSRRTGCAVHIQHVSCAASVERIRAARADGVRVSGEATPHHLLLCAEDIPGDDANWKMNPPLGTREDREAVRRGVLDGTLSVLATDHAPHPAAAKAHGFAGGPFGIVGLETALGASHRALVEECGMPLVEYIRRWTTGPASVVSACPLPEVPWFADGPARPFVLADFGTRRTVDPSRFLGGTANSPFRGLPLACVHGGVARFEPR